MTACEQTKRHVATIPTPGDRQTRSRLEVFQAAQALVRTSAPHGYGTRSRRQPETVLRSVCRTHLAVFLQPDLPQFARTSTRQYLAFCAIVWFGSVARRAARYSSKSCASSKSRTARPTAKAGRKCFCWRAIAWISTPRGLRWATSIAGRSNFSSVGSNAFWAANICCQPAPMAWRSKSTWP